MKKIIIICMEIYNREFLSYLLLSLKLNVNKYKIILTYDRFIKNFFEEFTNFLPKTTYILFKSAEKVTYNTILCKDYMKKLNIIILDAESGGFIESWYCINNRCYDLSPSVITKFFNWGEIENQMLRNKFPNQKNIFCITGNPRFDILKLKNIFDEEKNNWKQKFKKYVLIIGFFKPDKILMSHLLPENYNMLKTEEEKSKFEKNIICSSKVLELLKKLVKNLCIKYSDTNFVWKMHPRTHKQINNNTSTDNNELTNYFKDIKNFKLLSTSEMIEPLILGSEYVLHCNSTGGYQSYLLSKNNINFKPIINDYCIPCTNTHTSNYTGYICKNDIEVFELIDSNFQKKLQIDKIELNKRIYNFDFEKCSSTKIIKELNNINDNNILSNNLSDNIIDNSERELTTKINNILKTKDRIWSGKRNDEKYKSFNVNNITKYIDIIKSQYQDLNQYKFDLTFNKNSIIFN